MVFHKIEGKASKAKENLIIKNELCKVVLQQPFYLYFYRLQYLLKNHMVFSFYHQLLDLL